MKTITRTIQVLPSCYIQPIQLVELTDGISIAITVDDYSIPSTAEATVAVSNPDGTSYTGTADISSNAITFTPANDTFSGVGTAKMQIDVADSGKHIFTSHIPVRLIKNLFAVDINNPSTKGLIGDQVVDLVESKMGDYATNIAELVRVLCTDAYKKQTSSADKRQHKQIDAAVYR